MIKLHSVYSIQSSVGQIEAYVAKVASLGLKFICLTDDHSVSGCVELLQAVKKINKGQKNQIKPIFGCNLRVAYKDTIGTVVIWCKNLQGWKLLIAALAESDMGVEGVQSLSWDKFLGYAQKGDWIVWVGGMGSIIFKIAFKDYYRAILSNDSTEVESLFDNVVLQEFISGHPFINLYREDHGFMAENIVNAFMGLGDSPVHNPIYYVDPEDLQYQKALICTKSKTKLSEIVDTENAGDNYRIFFEGNYSNALTGWVEDPIVDELADSVESFDLAQKPQIPHYSDTTNYPISTSDEILLDLCRKGWIARKLNIQTHDDPDMRSIYKDRVERELALFKSVGMSDYILIIYDMANYCRKHGVSCGLRGSAAGCFISYLLGITTINAVIPDPILGYSKDRELLLERFFHEGRMTEGNVSLPDIDLDVPISFRAKLIEYCREKYGHQCVAHIITFTRMDARKALKEAFRVLDSVPNSFQVANEITKWFFDKAKVQEDLEDLKEANPSYNITQYCIDHSPQVAGFAMEYPREFEFALKLTDTISAQGKHAAGIVIAAQPLAELFPITKDPKTGDPLVAVDMMDLEYMGGVKYDLLNVAAYDKIDIISQMIRGGLKSPPRLTVDMALEGDDIL